MKLSAPKNITLFLSIVFVSAGFILRYIPGYSENFAYYISSIGYAFIVAGVIFKKV